MPDRAAFESAAVVQRQFEERFAGEPDIVGIGLGQNAAADGFAITVQVSKPPVAGSFPDRFGGLEVVVTVVGPSEAFRSSD